MDDEEMETPFRVIIHNDDVTPMDFVVVALVNIFELGLQRAIVVMQEAHIKGQSLVTVLPYKEAHRRVYNAQSAAREFGYPLSFTLEPDD
ncbi:MAG TPA: ATP-dependent Clp protease adaptor ClpS [Chloroflexi bacterium]|nr:ATP-dependent Clp protease adaptor ClpS [Chloroflexota bacterium]